MTKQFQHFTQTCEIQINGKYQIPPLQAPMRSNHGSEKRIFSFRRAEQQRSKRLRT